jgi:hypothetical protein
VGFWKVVALTEIEGVLGDDVWSTVLSVDISPQDDQLAADKWEKIL